MAVVGAASAGGGLPPAQGLPTTTAESPHPQPGGVWARLAARLSPAEQRPRVRLDNLEVAHHRTRSGVPYVVVRCRSAATYLKLSPAEYELLPLMDGTRTVRALVLQYFLRHRVLAFPRVAGLVAQLRQHRFLEAPPLDAYAPLARRLRQTPAAEALARAVAGWLLGREIVLDGLDRWVGAVYRVGGRLLFTRPAQLVLLAIAALGLSFFALGLGSNSRRLFRLGDSYLLGFAAFVLVSVVATALHELGHALALKHVGREVRRGGFQVYYGLPTFFVDTTDVWMAGPRARLAVSWAGPYTALVLGGLASIGTVWFGREPLGDVLFTWALVSYLDVLFNLNPLLELDGYYLLVDALERPLLRHDALAFVRGPLWRKLLRRARLSPDERLLAVFGLAAAGWSLFSVWLALFLWERRLAGLLAELARSDDLGPRVVLVALLAGLATSGALALLLLERVARPWVFRHSAILARKTRALRRRQTLHLLRQLPFLEGLPEARLVDIAERCRHTTAGPGQVVVREGQVGDEFYLVHHGTLEVRREGAEQPLATIGPGGYFGEVALLRHVPRTASVVALTRCDLFAMRGDDFRAAVAHELQTFQRLQAHVEQRAELAALPLLAGLGPQELDLLLARLDEETYPPGAGVMRQGEPGDRFYVLREGQVQVEADGQVVGTLGPGDYFGEIALLMAVPRTATVRVVGPRPARVWALDRAAFHDILVRYLGRAPALEGTGAERLRLLGMSAAAG